MKAVLCKRFGPPETLVVEDVPGKIRPLVSARYPLEDTATALRLLQERKAQGKIVIVPRAGRNASS